jgi:hypothetical protein
MPYVQRDETGKVVALSSIETDATPEWVADGDHDLNDFLLDMALGKEAVDTTAVRALNESDLAMIRVVEDVIDLLIDQNLLRFTDLPPAAQDKLMERRSLRQTLTPLNLMSDDQGII